MADQPTSVGLITAQTIGTVATVTTSTPVAPAAPPVTAVSLLEAIKTGTADDAAFEAVGKDLKQSLAFVNLQPLHVLISLPDAFRSDMADKILETFKLVSFFKQESAQHHTPLIQACSVGKLDAVKYLLDKGADPNQLITWNPSFWSRESTTPLLTAIKSGQLAVVEVLLERGADPTKADTNGRTPCSQLLLTSMWFDDKLSIIRSMLSRMTFDQAWDQYPHLVGSQLAVYEFFFSDEAKLKATKLSPSDLVDKILRTQNAPSHIRAKWLDALLSNGSKFAEPFVVTNIRGHPDSPPLHIAVDNDSVDEIKTLIQYGADPNTYGCGRTALHLACWKASTATITELLNAGADPLCIETDTKRTTLHALLCNTKQQVIKEILPQLIERGVDPAAKDISANTALGYALTKPCKFAIKRLLTEDNMDEPVHWLRRPMTLQQYNEISAKKNPMEGRFMRPIEEFDICDEEGLDDKLSEHQRLTGHVLHQFRSTLGQTPMFLLIKHKLPKLIKRILSRRPELALQKKRIKPDWPSHSHYRGLRVEISPAEYAVIHGDLDSFTLMAKEPMCNLDPNMWIECYKMRFQPIHGFSSLGEEQAIKGYELLSSIGKNLEINTRNRSGETPLHIAARSGNRWFCMLLLHRGADVSIRNNLGNTPLALAPHNGHWDVALLLLSHGANINDYFYPPRRRNNMDPKCSLLSLLGEHSKEAIRAIRQFNTIEPQHLFSLKNCPDLIQEWFEGMKGKQLLASVKNPAESLFKVIKQVMHTPPNAGVCDIVVELAASMNGSELRNKRGDSLLAYIARFLDDKRRDSPLSEAGRQQCIDLVLKLIKRGMIDPASTSSSDGNTFFHILVRNPATTLDQIIAAVDADRMSRQQASKENMDVEKAKEAAGASGGEEEMDLEGATKEKQETDEVDEDTLEAKVKRALDARNACGQTPLLTALRPYSFATRRCTPVISALLKLGADSNAKDGATGNTALFYAVMSDNLVGARELIAYGADINAKNHQGETPLFIAGRRNLWKMTLYLLLVGADPHATNNNGECVLIASSALCASVIYDYVSRPHSLYFIANILFPEHASVVAPPDEKKIASTEATAIEASAALGDAPGATEAVPGTLVPQEPSTSIAPSENQEDKGKEKEGDEDEEQEKQSEPDKPLLEYFPELIDVKGIAEAAAEDRKQSKASLVDRQRQRKMNLAVKQVSELLRRVLEALQLYQGAIDEEEEFSISEYQGEESDRRQRWERVSSLKTLKAQLAGWLRKSNARIPRITRNLSFSTLSEGEMVLYLKQWKSLRRQRNQRKRKRGEEIEEDYFASSPASQGQEDWTIDVKRPRTDQGEENSSDQSDDIPLPVLSVPEVESIPLPPPFVPADESVPFDRLARWLVLRTRKLVKNKDNIASALVGAGFDPIDYEDPEDDDGDDGDKEKKKTLEVAPKIEELDDSTPLSGVGLLAENGYLLDAYLLSSDDPKTTVQLQAFFVVATSEKDATEEPKATDHASEEGMEVVNDEAQASEVRNNESEEKTKEESAEGAAPQNQEAESSDDSHQELRTNYAFFVWDGNSTKMNVYKTAEEAISDFKRRFFRFTGHQWDDRANFHHHEPTPENTDKEGEQIEKTAAPETIETAPQPQPTDAAAPTELKPADTTEKMDVEVKADEPKQNQEEVETLGYFYLPTNHEAVLRHAHYAKLYGEEEEEEEEDENNSEEDDDELSDGDEDAIRQFDAGRKNRSAKKEPSEEKRLFDMLEFVSNKKRLWSFCDRVGLFEMSGMGQLTSAQIKNAYQILNVISGILAYKKEMKKRNREIPKQVKTALIDLSNKFHCILPFNFSNYNLSLQIMKRKILREKLNLLQSLQEIGIGMEVLHEVALPHKRKLIGDEEEDLPSLTFDDVDIATMMANAGNVMTQAEKEKLEDEAGEIDENESFLKSGSDSAQNMARMKLLCAALRAKLTPVDKQSEEWEVITKLMSTGSSKVLDAFKVEREGEKERYQPFSALPNRTLLCHGTDVCNVMGILRKGMCIAPKEANSSGTNFGKGLYFADHPQKSLGYMELSAGKGCFLLCEVALGEHFIRKSTGYRPSPGLPPGFHNTWGQGKHLTDPEAALYTDDGVVIPMGESKIKSRSLGYNEFIVYNEGQVCIRYLLVLGSS